MELLSTIIRLHQSTDQRLKNNKETQKKGDPRLQFNSMQILQEVMGSHTKKLTIQLLNYGIN